MDRDLVTGYCRQHTVCPEGPPPRKGEPGFGSKKFVGEKGRTGAEDDRGDGRGRTG